MQNDVFPTVLICANKKIVDAEWVVLRSGISDLCKMELLGNSPETGERCCSIMRACIPKANRISSHLNRLSIAACSVWQQIRGTIQSGANPHLPVPDRMGSSAYFTSASCPWESSFHCFYVNGWNEWINECKCEKSE